MKSHSRSILYVVDDNDKDIPFNDIMDKCNYVFFKMSNFNKVKFVFRYTTKDGYHVALVSLENINDIFNKKNLISEYIINRIKLGLPHKLNEIKSFTLSYSYEKPIFKSKGRK
nr:hypothetical protein [Rhizoctonia sp.]